VEHITASALTPPCWEPVMSSTTDSLRELSDPGRSERRMREAARAVVALEGGADEVEFGQVVYVVDG
jgi:hypothetical protein